tara:strand:+ start:4102 stop:5166 length:1065 start_codon:yes stop_codon:yes gene_type:complete
MIKIFKLVIANIIVFLLIFGSLEIFFRLKFPEFKGHIFSQSKSMGINYIDGQFYGYQIRSPQPNDSRIIRNPLILIFGDSISGGFGTAYEDIWWRKLERLLKIKEIDREVISISDYGNNLGDSASNIKKAINNLVDKDDIKIDKIIYQFNFNDIMPFSRSDLQELTPSNSELFSRFAKWRYQYANYSVFLRTTQHYLGGFIRKTSGTCIDRGWHALGPYTWTYGSKAFMEESEIYWTEFNKNIAEIKQLSDSKNIKFEILLSPILYDIDFMNAHPHFNYLNYNFDCATIDPRARFKKIERSLGIKIHDPAPALRHSFEMRIREGNFIPYFFTADDNHFTSVAAGYVAEVIANEW